MIHDWDDRLWVGLPHFFGIGAGQRDHGNGVSVALGPSGSLHIAYYAEGEGDLAPFIPLLRLGEAIHVGKHAVWGNGWIRVEVEQIS